MKLFDLSGKAAIVTGSSRGIGRAIAAALAAHGARVAISSRKQAPCEQAAVEINAAHGEGRAIAVPADIASRDDLRHLVDAARAAFGKIDILVCNAASNPHYGPMADIADDQFRKILDNNILSNHWLIQMIAPEMAGRRDGSIIVVSSIAGIKGSDVIGAYSVSKAADMQLVRSLAHEYGRHNVRINCIAPGLIRTDFARALWEDARAEAAVNALTPLGRIGEAHEIAGAAVYLAAPASSYMTGQNIVIDGGRTI